MNDVSEAAIPERAPPSPPRWKGKQSLELVCQLNLRCIGFLCDLVASDALGVPSSRVTENRECWLRLSSDARHRAAQMPFIIVDVEFRNEAWWRRVVDSNAAGAGPAINGIRREANAQLAQEVLMFAWQTARWDRAVARQLFGMASSVAEIIAVLTPHQVLDIASREHLSVRVRWAENVPFWKDFLMAAANSDDDRLADVHLYAKLLLCGELADPKA